MNNKTDTPNKIHLAIYKMYLYLIERVRSNKRLHQFIFKYRPCKVQGGYWDWTTLILKKALRNYLKPNDVFLDMGTGSVGVLALYASLGIGCKRIQAVDYLSQIVYSAKENAEAHKLNIKFCCSNLFSSVSGRFDVIAFNAPYIDINKGKINGVLKDELSEKRFSGGVGGGETIARFLREAPEHISEGGKVLLGVNHYHIKRSTLLSLINKSNFELHECIESPFIPATVYVLL